MTLEILAGGVLLATVFLAALFPSRCAAVALLAAVVSVGLAGLLGTTPVWSAPAWSALGMVLGLGILAAAAPRRGLVAWAAVRLLRRSRGRPYALLVLMCLLVAALSVAVNNTVAMAAAGALTVAASRRLGLDVVPFLVVEGVCAGLCGILTLTSSTPAVLVGRFAGLSYVDVLLGTGPPVIGGVLITLAAARVVFRKAFAPLSEGSARTACARVDAFDEWAAAAGRRMHPVWVVIALVLLLLLLHGLVPEVRRLDPTLIVLAGAALALLAAPQAPRETLLRTDWSLMLYLVGTVLVVGVCQASGVVDRMVRFAAASPAAEGLAASWAGMAGASVLGALLGTVQTSVVLSALLQEASARMDVGLHGWALLLGCGLGGVLPPLGGGAVIVALSLLRREDRPCGLARYAVLSLPFWVLLLLLGAAQLWAVAAFGRPYLLAGGAAAWAVALGGAAAVLWRCRRTG